MRPFEYPEMEADIARAAAPRSAYERSAAFAIAVWLFSAIVALSALFSFLTRDPRYVGMVLAVLAAFGGIFRFDAAAKRKALSKHSRRSSEDDQPYTPPQLRLLR